MANTPAPAIDWNDVQGMVLRGYGKHPYSANLVLQVDDAAAARAWLSQAWERITTAQRARSRADSCYLNLALTRTGLSKLGFNDSIMSTFPTAFLDGMSSANRSRILGDESDNAPENWLWGGPGQEVDALVLIFAKDQDILQKAIQSERAAMTGMSMKTDPLLTQLWPDQREHFGFHDGISQPEIEGSPMLFDAPGAGDQPSAPNVADTNVIKAGEFLLGYLNEYDVLPDSIDVPLETDAGGLLPSISMPDGSARRISVTTGVTWSCARWRSMSRNSGLTSIKPPGTPAARVVPPSANGLVRSSSAAGRAERP